MGERLKRRFVGVAWAVMAIVGVGCAAEEVESTAPPEEPPLEQATSALSGTSPVRPFQPNIRWSGRTVSASVSTANTNVALAASESGGLFRTANGATTWTHVDSLARFRVQDVRFSPRNAQIVLATTSGDWSTVNQGGIWRSTDAGVTWTRPSQTAISCASEPRPGAWGSPSPRIATTCSSPPPAASPSAPTRA